MNLALGYLENADRIASVPAAPRDGAEAIWRFLPRGDGAGIILPDGRCDVIFRFTFDADGARIREIAPVITGPATRPYPMAYSRTQGWAGVRLRPDMAMAIWGAGLPQARDSVVFGLEAVGATMTAPILSLLQSPQEVRDVASLTAQLVGVFNALPPCPEHQLVKAALAQIHADEGHTNIETLAAGLDITPRHVSRAFSQAVGLSPKLFASIVQFHHALRLMQDGALSAIAAADAAGYADQAHMSRAFCRFGGFSPSSIPEGVNLPGFSVLKSAQ